MTQHFLINCIYSAPVSLARAAAGTGGDKISFTINCHIRPPPAARPPQVELQTNLREDYSKFYKHGEGPYKSLRLVESVLVRTFSAAAAGLCCLSRRVCAVSPKNIATVFGRCRPTKPRLRGWLLREPSFQAQLSRGGAGGGTGRGVTIIEWQLGHCCCCAGAGAVPPHNGTIVSYL